MATRQARKPKTARVVPMREPVGKLDIPALTTAEIQALTEEGPTEVIRITKPKLRTTVIRIVGIAPYVQHAFSEKQRKVMEETQRQGQQARGKKTRTPKDFEAVYDAAKHKFEKGTFEEGACGIPAPAFRNAMISACKLLGYKMTHAKLSIFIEQDGLDAGDGTPLVRIEGEPVIHRATARNANGSADIRWRPMWKKWAANVAVTWDEDQFSATDIWNLLLRAGMQVGIGEGRPDSPNSYGMGWGRFKIEQEK